MDSFILLKYFSLLLRLIYFRQSGDIASPVGTGTYVIAMKPDLRLLMSLNPASHKQDGSASGHWNNIYIYSHTRQIIIIMTSKKSIITPKLLNRTSQQIQRPVDLLFDAEFDAEYGAIEREEGKTHLVANP
jgi:hypothetical protein